MAEVALIILAFIWPPMVAWLVLTLLPRSIGKFMEKEIERRSDVKLERIKAEIQSSYSTLQTSADVLMASSSGMHPHIIEAVSVLWSTVNKMREKFAGLTAFDSIILAEEAEQAFANQKDSQYQRILEFVRPYQNVFDELNASPFLCSDLDRHRLFCGDKVWLLFYTIRAVFMRGALLISWSFERGQFQDWRNDRPMGQLFETIIPAEVVEQGRKSSSHGLSTLVARLEAEFLHEAARAMSGSKAMADSLADVQSIMLLQNAKLAEKGK
jgi:hypothetical protein